MHVIGTFDCGCQFEASPRSTVVVECSTDTEAGEVIRRLKICSPQHQCNPNAALMVLRCSGELVFEGRKNEFIQYSYSDFLTTWKLPDGPRLYGFPVDVPVTNPPSKCVPLPHVWIRMRVTEIIPSPDKESLGAHVGLLLAERDDGMPFYAAMRFHKKPDLAQLQQGVEQAVEFLAGRIDDEVPNEWVKNDGSWFDRAIVPCKDGSVRLENAC